MVERRLARKHDEPRRSRGSLLARLMLPLLLLLPITGCEWKAMAIQLPTFFSAGVEEVHFWRLNESGEEFVRDGHLVFSPLIGPPGAQIIRYTMISPTGVTSLTLSSEVEVVGDSIVIDVWFARWSDPGQFRVSARNSRGESELSAQEIPL
jgi:hypothetical protein